MPARGEKRTADKAVLGAVVSAVVAVLVEAVATSGFGVESLLAAVAAAVPVGISVYVKKNFPTY